MDAQPTPTVEQVWRDSMRLMAACRPPKPAPAKRERYYQSVTRRRNETGGLRSRLV